MDVGRSISRIGAAETGQAKRKKSVHYRSDPDLIASARASSDHGSAEGEWKRLSIRERTIIDIDNVPEDTTPPPAMNEGIDVSDMLGDYQRKDIQTGEYDDHHPDRGRHRWRKKGKSKTPGQRIVLFAIRLALIEKAASGIGTLAFLWATVVILGGFASTVTFVNFWVVTLIILAEGSRIFSRSRELEWQQLSSKSIAGTALTHHILKAAQSISSPFINSSHRDLKPARNHWFRRQKASSGTANHLPTRMPTPSPDESAHGASESPWTWSMTTLPLLPYVSDVLTTHVVSQILYFAQLASAMMCIGLSVWRLIMQKFYENEVGDAEGQPNVTVSLNVFYVLAILEAGLFLLERCYWEYRMRYKKLLDQVRHETGLGNAELGRAEPGKAELGIDSADVVRQFFYDVYGRCLAGSVFDGLDMDLVSYSISWLQCEDFKQQLAGARLLNRFISKRDNKPRKQNDRFASNALRRLGTTPGVIERLVEMLSWNSRHEKVLLQEIASIICRLVVYNRNCSRFVAVPGFTDGLVALLWTPDSSASYNADQISKREAVELRLTGLRILKYLCKDHKNCLKIGETRGLMSILMVFLEVRQGVYTFNADEPGPDDILRDRLKTFKRSLQVLLLLAAATNTSGGELRIKIASIVSGLKNLRDVVEFASEQPRLQRLSIEILYHLAMEEGVRKNIGATGGVIRKLFYVFAQYDSVREWVSGNIEPEPDRKIREQRRVASEKAGEALTRLVLQNERNCMRLLYLEDAANDKPLVRVMVDSLYKPDTIARSAAMILRNVLKYADETTKVEISNRCVPVIIRNVFRPVSLTKSEMYEASLGLASRAIEFLDVAKYVDIVQNVNKSEFVEQLIKNLRHTPTTNKYSRIRRYSVELILALTAKDDSFLYVFQLLNLDLRRVLTDTLESISEVENFCLFSGLIGYTRHSEEMEDLVERSIKAVDDYHKRAISSPGPGTPL